VNVSRTRRGPGPLKVFRSPLPPDPENYCFVELSMQNTFVPCLRPGALAHRSNTWNSPVQGERFIVRNALILVFVCCVGVGWGLPAAAHYRSHG
jgi:hypothetical protein